MNQNNQNVLVNPRMLEVGYRREKANPFAMKSYFPVVGQVIRTPYRTASEAKIAAVALWEKMCAEYDRQVAERGSSSPVAAEEEQVVAE